ncbi:hypothetical protein WJX81_002915 [Elliptochloris bilobata]|uniref:Uncharacterized protein n=1 Tax=Elliptochloris bilobata TaxID=381761 RepID=A0AAW1RLP4_9CHLO
MRYVRTWQENHPGWVHKLWTDDDNDALVREHYPWFKDTYDALPKRIMKADTCRALYMHHYGGMYADLDFESLRNVEPLLEGRHVLLAAMTADASWEHNIPNAWMASVRHHPFWLFVLQTITRTVGAGDFTRWDYVENTTGPIMLGKAVEAFRRANGPGLTVLDPGVIYPVNWQVTMFTHETPAEENAMTVCDPFNAAFSNERCKALFPDAYAITYWSHSWAPPGY